MIRGIIFDYGGTIDTCGEHWSDVIYRGWCHVGIEITPEIFRSAYVYGERSLAAPGVVLPTDNFRDTLSKKIDKEFEYISKFCPTLNFNKKIGTRSAVKSIVDYCYNTARAVTTSNLRTLEELAKKYTLGVVSNFYGNLRTVLADFGLEKVFQCIVDSAVVRIRKPDARIFELCLMQMRLEPSETMVVGDSYKNDIIPAQTLGCHTFQITPQNTVEAIGNFLYTIQNPQTDSQCV